MRFLIGFFALVSVQCFAQSSYVPLNEDYYHLLDRYQVKMGRNLPLFQSVKPFKRADVALLLDSGSAAGVFASGADQFNLTYLGNDNWEWTQAATADSKKPVLRHIYQKKSDFYAVHTEDFDLHVNPVLYFMAGDDSRSADRPFLNTRGFEIRGMIDKKVGFYTYVGENQAVLPSYVMDGMLDNPVVPHEGFWKDYKSGNGVDFLHARGHISFEATRHINIQFGHDRFFIGNGYRSLAFSDFAPPALFLKTNVRVWKLNYTFMINQMTAAVSDTVVRQPLGGLVGNRSGYPNKYNAFHHLSINIGKKLNIGVFESVIFSSADSSGGTGFRADYLNPIIFFRAIEQQNGSSDNVILGLDFNWYALPRVSLYGQFVLDELVIANLRAGNGWWANKFGIQLGAKYIDAFGLANLDLQGELNIVRPYTYSHDTQFGSYTNYQQPIAHPLGANFSELIGIVRYQPVPKLTLKAKLIAAKIGRDGTGENWGADLLKNNAIRQRDFGNTLSQGISNEILFASLSASWQLKHNLFIDGVFTQRNSSSDAIRYNQNTSLATLALRWNIAQRLYEF